MIITKMPWTTRQDTSLMTGSTSTLKTTFFTTAVNAFFKDMAQIVSICLQFGMWLTPIMWDPNMFPNRPAWLEQVLKINPMYYIVAGYRDSMLTGHWFWERPSLTVYYWMVTLLLLIFGLKTFRKLRPHFSDVL